MMHLKMFLMHKYQIPLNCFKFLKTSFYCLKVLDIYVIYFYYTYPPLPLPTTPIFPCLFAPCIPIFLLLLWITYGIQLVWLSWAWLCSIHCSMSNLPTATSPTIHAEILSDCIFYRTCTSNHNSCILMCALAMPHPKVSDWQLSVSFISSDVP